MRLGALLQSSLLDHPRRSFAVAVVLAAAIISFDYYTDYEMRVGVLYVVPVFLALWLAHLLIHRPSTDAAVHLWEAGMHLPMYVLVAMLVTRLKEALQLAEDRFVSAFESLDAAAWVIDPATGGVLYANRHFQRALPPGEAHDAPSGRWFFVLVRTMRWLDGRAVQLHVATDITETKRAEERARRQEEQLQSTARLIAVGEMASTLAHELNQPLGAIANYNNGAVRLLRSGSPDLPTLLELMEKCSAQAIRAGEVVRRIREFVRRRPPALRAENTGELLSQAIAAALAEAGSSPAATRVEIAPGLPPVAVDRVMIERVVLNLVRNALESMSAVAPGERSLVLRAVAERGQVEIQVADRGSGVDAELEKQLFQPFFTTKPEGLGLGLAICRSIVEYHRGELWCTRNPEGGTTFRFTLPVAGEPR
jgi:C4-dicarboxylate-specific signal transduction histidine kinase